MDVTAGAAEEATGRMHDDYVAAPEEGIPFDPTSATPHSLMDERPPRPPSPYKTMQQRSHRANAATAALSSMSAKSSISAAFLRGRRHPHFGSAAALSSETPTAGAAPHSHVAGEVSTWEATATVAGGTTAATNSTMSAMEEYMMEEAQRQTLQSYEEGERNAVLANEEVVFTTLLINALHERATLLAGTEAEELVVADMLRRATARREMLRVIEIDVAARLREERLSELLQVRFRALLPAHAAGCQRIQTEEKEDLLRLFRWHKEHRPLGAGRFIKGPEEDYRLKYASRATSATPGSPNSMSLALENGAVAAGGEGRSSGGSAGGSSAPNSRDYALQLKQRGAAASTPNAALGELALLHPSRDASPHTTVSTQDGTFGPGEEALFAQEGRLRLQLQKTRRHEELRERRRVTEIHEEQAEARQYVLAEEALCWVQLTRSAVDGLYAAARATETRMAAGQDEDLSASAADAERKALKERLMRERGMLDVVEPPQPEEGDEEAEDEAAAEGPQKAEATWRASCSSAKAERRRESASTVTESCVSVEGSVHYATEADHEVGVAAVTLHEEEVEQVGEDSLAHLRLIAEETEDAAMCRQLTTMTASEGHPDTAAEL